MDNNIWEVDMGGFTYELESELDFDFYVGFVTDNN